MSIKLKDTILDYIDKAYKDSSGNVISSTYLPLSGGTITGFLKFNTSSTATYVQHKVNDVIKAELGYHPNYGVFIKNENSGKFLYVTDSGVAKFDGNTIIHSGNISSQSVNYATSAGNANTLDGIDSTGFLRYISHNATFSSVANISKDLTPGIHKIHISNVEYSSILTGYDFNGSYWQLYFHPSSGNSQNILYRATNCEAWKTLLDSNNSSVSGGGSSAGSSLTVKINGTTKTLTIPSSLPASDVYGWAKAANKPSYTYSEVGAPMHKYLFYKADYEHYVVLLCKIGTDTTGTNHRISGKIYTEAGGGGRYQAADIDVWRSDWSSGNDSYSKFNSYGIGEMWDLVTCKYGNNTYLAIRNRNIQACHAYFQGTATNIDFTAIKYYTSNTSTVNNSEINGSISVVSYFDRYAWKAEIPTKVSQLTNDSGYLTSLPSHSHDTLYVKYGKVAKSTADSTNAKPYIYNIENETVVSGYYAYWYILNLGQYSGSNFGTQIAMPYQDSLTDSELFIRSAKSGSWRAWRRVLHSNNYTEYTVTKTGTGASGTWGISVTGSAGSVAWGNVTGKPSTFTPSDHSHTFASLTSKPTTLSGYGITDAYVPRKSYNTTSSPSGYFKININSTNGWMLGFRVRVYQYYVYHDIRFSGYNYGANYWYSPKAELISSDLSSITVYFGYDATNKLWVAIPADRYTGIEIADVVNGYNSHGYGNNYDGLFTITNMSSLSGTIQSTQTIYPPSKTDHTHSQYLTSSSYTASDVLSKIKTVDGSGSGLDSDTLDGRQAGKFVWNIQEEDFNPSDIVGNYVGMSTQTGITSSWTHIISLDWRSTGTASISNNSANSSWETQLALPTQNRKGIYYRSFSSTAPYDWVRLIDSSNIGSQSVNYANSAGAVAWSGVTGKPSTFSPSSHTHSYLPFEQTVNSKDINTIKTTGFYYGYNMTNSAITAISSFIVAKYSSDWGTQIQLCSGTSRSYIRYWRNSGGIMGNWYTLAYTSDIPTKVSQLTNDSGYLTSLPSHTHSYLPLSGGTMTGNITVHIGADGCGLKFGTSTLNSLSNQLIWQSPEAIRFGSTSWDWNSWAGLKYNHSNKIIYLGLADNTIFNANSAQSGGKLYTPGVSSIHIGNGTYTVLHTGNWSSYCAASSHTHSDYMVKSDPIGSGTLRMDGSNSRGSFPAVKLHISGVNWSQMLMNGSGELEFRAGGSQDAAYVTTRMGACCCTTLYINGEQITFVT